MKELSYCNIAFFIGCSGEDGIVQYRTKEKDTSAREWKCSRAVDGTRNGIAQPQA